MPGTLFIGMVILVGKSFYTAASLHIEKKKKDTQKVSFYAGASDEARTRYLHLGKVALYQMSYTRSDKWYYSRPIEKVNPYFEIS